MKMDIWQEIFWKTRVSKKKNPNMCLIHVMWTTRIVFFFPVLYKHNNPIFTNETWAAFLCGTYSIQKMAVEVCRSDCSYSIYLKSVQMFCVFHFLTWSGRIADLPSKSSLQWSPVKPVCYFIIIKQVILHTKHVFVVEYHGSWMWHQWYKKHVHVGHFNAELCTHRWQIQDRYKYKHEWLG